MPSEARLHFINSRLCCAAALPPLTPFLFQTETAWLMLIHSASRGGSGGWRWVDFTTTTTYIAMPLATAITSRAGGRSLAMALRTQDFVGHCLLPPVSPHEDMGRDAISTTRLMSPEPH